MHIIIIIHSTIWLFSFPALIYFCVFVYNKGVTCPVVAKSIINQLLINKVIHFNAAISRANIVLDAFVSPKVKETHTHNKHNSAFKG